MTNQDTDLARALIAAHDGGPVISTVSPTDVPVDMPAVYALQDRIMAAIGPAGGWKIAAGGAGEPLCSPIPANRFFNDGAEIRAGHHRFFITEVEVAVKLSADLAGTASEAEVEAAIGSVHPALEMIGNPFADRDATPRNVQLGDLQSNGAVVVGPAMKDSVRDVLPTLPIALTYGGKPIKTVDTGASWTDIVAAITWLASHAEKRGLPLTAGQVIITGARIAVPLDKADEASASLGDWGRVSATFSY